MVSTEREGENSLQGVRSYAIGAFAVHLAAELARRGSNPDRAASKNLKRTLCVGVTNAWREIEYGTNYKGLKPEQIWEVAQKVYAGYPDLLEAARKTIFN